MSIIENAKEIAKLVQQMDNIELYKKIIDFQLELIDLVEQNRTLRTEIILLHEKLELKEKLIYENNAYWIKKDDDSKDGPFCSNCWDTKNLTVRMLIYDNEEKYHSCPNCKFGFNLYTIPMPNIEYNPWRGY
jgi:hypothetical protein